MFENVPLAQIRSCSGQFKFGTRRDHACLVKLGPETYELLSGSKYIQQAEELDKDSVFAEIYSVDSLERAT
jgi:hypothetical protein